MTKPSWHSELLSARGATRRGVFVRGMACITLVGVALALHPLIAIVAGILACLVMFRPSTAMLAFLLLAAIIPNANHTFFGQGSLSQNHMNVVYFSLLLSSAATTIFLLTRHRLKIGQASRLFFICAVIGAIFALATSNSASLSFIGLIKFLLPIFTLSVWYDNIESKGTSAKEAPYVVAGMVSAVAILSMLFLVLGIGYEFDGKEFNGPLWDPQILGLLMILLLPSMIHLHRIPLWLRVAISIIALLLAWVAMSRTALAAFVILAVVEGARLALLPSFDRWRLARRDRWQMWPKLAFRLNIVALSGIALCSLWVASGIAKTEVGADASSEILSMEGYASTRAITLDRSMNNFRANLLTGIGFAVPSDPRLLDAEFAAANFGELRHGGETLVDTDKGNSFVAVFEENGLLGGPIWLGLFFFFVAGIAVRSPAGFSVVMIVVACAFGEATIFAATKVGLAQWVVLVAMAGVGAGRYNPVTAGSVSPSPQRNSSFIK